MSTVPVQGDPRSDRPVPTESTALRVLVTGSTGYVGSRLVPELLDAGHTVLAATRDESSLDDYPWGDRVEPRIFDVEDDDVVRAAVRDVDAVVYLVHSMESDDFVAKDRAAAERMAAACDEAGVERIVYLSGLVPDGDLSDHLSSRLEVEQVFLDAPVPATVLRAAMVVGSGSTSYELLRRLSERVPLLTPVPSWMCRKIQPVAVEDVVHLVDRALLGEPRNRHYDIGGDEVVTYPELLERYAAVAGLRRARFSVPFVPRWVVGRACALISGMDRPTVTSLVESLSHDMVCGEDAVRRDLLEPGYAFTGLTEALERSRADRREPGTSQAGDVQAAAGTDPA
ncbi:NAD(P)H-binding protein [Nocardioides sp. 1609]|uniref:NAD(P)H-binding protein n=1 Tax=Nocardioides sp. 1609 TaxID=2508327 RepID=UPI00107066F2|nr:NAD(P)H-binding protein [Nocardioides sp. 1609]